MVVGVDIDGVLADFNTAFVALFKDVAPEVKFPAIDDTYPNTWNYHKAAGVTSEQSNEAWRRIKASPFYWFDLQPYPNVTGFLVWLKHFSRNSADVYFITDRSGSTAKYQTERWLHKAGFPEPTVLLSADKAALCNGLRIDYYVDDKNENCQNVVANSPKTKVFQYKRPWNEPQEGCRYISSLLEFQNALVLESLGGPPNSVVLETGVKSELNQRSVSN